MRILLLLLALALPATAHAQAKLLPKNPGKEPLAVPPENPATATLNDLAQGDPKLVALMDRIESGLTLPAGARPLDSYTRRYAWADRDQRMVTGVFIAVTPATGRAWVEFDDLPLTLGGGCRFVSLVYDTRTGAVQDLACNQPGP